MLGAMPNVSYEPSDAEVRDLGLWLWFATLSLWPRVLLIAFWIFGSLLGDAFSTWVIPVFGFFAAPATTASYALMWGLNSETVSGAEWLVVAVGVLLDLWMWGSWARLRGRG